VDKAEVMKFSELQIQAIEEAGEEAGVDDYWVEKIVTIIIEKHGGDDVVWAGKKE